MQSRKTSARHRHSSHADEEESPSKNECIPKLHRQNCPIAQFGAYTHMNSIYQEPRTFVLEINNLHD